MSRLCENKISAKTVNSGNRGCESLVVKNPATWCRENGTPLDKCAFQSIFINADGSRTYLTTHPKDVDNCDQYFDPYTMEKCGGGTDGYRGGDLSFDADAFITKGEIPGTCYELNEPSNQCDVPEELINDPLIKQGIKRELALEILENKWKLNCGGRLPGTCSNRRTQEVCEQTFSTDTNTGYEYCIWNNGRCVPSSTEQNPDWVNYQDPAVCNALGDAKVDDLYVSQDPLANTLTLLQPRVDFTPENQMPGNIEYNNSNPCNLGHLKEILDNNCSQFSFLTELNPENIAQATDNLASVISPHSSIRCTPQCYTNFIRDWYARCYSDADKKNTIKDEMRRKLNREFSDISYDDAQDIAVNQQILLDFIPSSNYCTEQNIPAPPQNIPAPPQNSPASPQYRNPNAPIELQTKCNLYNLVNTFHQNCGNFIIQGAVASPDSASVCTDDCKNNFANNWWSNCSVTDGSIENDPILSGVLNEMFMVNIYQEDPLSDFENMRSIVNLCRNPPGGGGH